MEAQVKIPDVILSDIVKAQVIESLSKTEGIIEKTVSALLNAKADTYSRQTLLQQMAEQMIREVAKDIYAEWLNEKKGEIKKAVVSNLKNESTLVDTIAEKLVKGLGASFYVDVRMNVED